MKDTKREPINGLPAREETSGATRRDERAAETAQTKPQTVALHTISWTHRGWENLPPSGSVYTQIARGGEATRKLCGIYPFWRDKNNLICGRRLLFPSFLFNLGHCTSLSKMIFSRMLYAPFLLFAVATFTNTEIGMRSLRRRKRGKEGDIVPSHPRG